MGGMVPISRSRPLPRFPRKRRANGCAAGYARESGSCDPPACARMSRRSFNPTGIFTKRAHRVPSAASNASRYRSRHIPAHALRSPQPSNGTSDCIERVSPLLARHVAMSALLESLRALRRATPHAPRQGTAGAGRSGSPIDRTTASPKVRSRRRKNMRTPGKRRRPRGVVKRPMYCPCDHSALWMRPARRGCRISGEVPLDSARMRRAGRAAAPARHLRSLHPRLRRCADDAKQRKRLTMSRALWKGAISFGLVHIPVELHPAEQRHGMSFDARQA